jgi:hypothetical protein
MIELFFLACLIDNPTLCRERELTFSGEGLTPMQCMAASQPQLAAWREAHPRYFVKRWGCRPARLYSKA